jgi:ABC-2 type transport system permease protein
VPLQLADHTDLAGPTGSQAGKPVPLFPTMYRRAVRETRRIILVVIAIPLIVPIFMLVVFSQVFAPIIRVAGFSAADSYVQYIAPGAILMAVMLSATGAVHVAVERQGGFYDRMRISPRGPRASNLARRAADATKLVLFALVLVVVSWLAGAQVHNWPLVLLLGTALPVLWGFAYGGIVFSVCLRTGKPELAEALLPVFFPLLFMSSAFVPTNLLPHWMRTFATYNPLTYLCDAIRSAYLGHLNTRALIIAVLTTAALGIVTQLLTTRAEHKVTQSR